MRERELSVFSEDNITDRERRKWALHRRASKVYSPLHKHTDVRCDYIHVHVLLEPYIMQVGVGK